MPRLVALALLLPLVAAPCLAWTRDARPPEDEALRDPPELPRYPLAILVAGTVGEFDGYEVPVRWDGGRYAHGTIEGRVTSWSYEQHESALAPEVVRHYAAVATEAGFEVVFVRKHSDSEYVLTARRTGARAAWVVVHAFAREEALRTEIALIGEESAPARFVEPATDLLVLVDELRREGRVELIVAFEPALAAFAPGAEDVLEPLITLFAQHPSARIRLGVVTRRGIEPARLARARAALVRSRLIDCAGLVPQQVLVGPATRSLAPGEEERLEVVLLGPEAPRRTRRPAPKPREEPQGVLVRTPDRALARADRPLGR